MFLLFHLFTIESKGQITINSNVTATQMAQTLVGSGVQISNAIFNGAPNSSRGTFTNLSSNLQMSSGIVLTTGRVDVINNGANSANASFTFPGPRISDIDLENLIGDSDLDDACVLEFDFKPIGNFISFNFIFGSEEYNEFNCDDFNDVLGFFISGPGIVGIKNIALVPGTNIPVAINSINNGIPGPGGDITNCTNMGPGSPFIQHFINNANAPNIVYDGLTKVLQIASQVQKCQTYHIKLAIADFGDNDYDSGVFIEAGSLESPIPEVSITASPGFPICEGTLVTFTSHSTNVGNNPTYIWRKNEIVVGGNQSTYTDNNLKAGDVIYLEINADINCNGDKAESNHIIITVLPPIDDILEISICDGENYIF